MYMNVSASPIGMAVVLILPRPPLGSPGPTLSPFPNPLSSLIGMIPGSFKNTPRYPLLLHFPLGHASPYFRSPCAHPSSLHFFNKFVFATFPLPSRPPFNIFSFVSPTLAALPHYFCFRLPHLQWSFVKVFQCLLPMAATVPPHSGPVFTKL